jgi:predicted transcriptional regulator
MATAKDVLAEILAHQPADSSYTELVRELAFSAMVQQGLSDSDNNKLISNEEMHKRIRSWRT